jgi:hypothetical protein
MRIKIVKDNVFSNGCNFCDNKIAISTPVYGVIRNSGNSMYARMCDDCLKELIKFRKQYFENIF